MIHTLIEYAKAYIDLEWSLIPILPETKTPAVKWGEFQTRRATIEEVKKWLDNGWFLAVVTGDISGIIVIDDDRVKNGLVEWGFESPVIAKTQSNGKHYYHLYDREIHSHTNTKIHVDLKAWHSYCLLPPFKGREWVREPFGNIGKLLPISDETLRIIRSDSLEATNFSKPLKLHDFIDIPEGSRTDSLYRVACSVFNNSTKDDGLRILAGVNATYSPPLDNKEFTYQVSKAWDFVEKNPKSKHIFDKTLGKLKSKKFKLTDTGNAELIAFLFGDKVRFDHRRKRWLLWQGHRWQPDTDQAINRYAIESTRQRLVVASDIIDPDQKIKIAKWSISSESRAKLDSATSILKSLLPIADSGDNWDADNTLLSCVNGILDLKSGLIRNGKPEDRITMVTGTSYEPDAQCPLWERFISEIFEGNEELIHYVHKALGYSLTGSIKEQVVFFGFGTGSNGKSVFFSTIREVLKDYCFNAPASMFQRNLMNTSTNDVAATEFKRFLMSSEILSSTKIDEVRLKKWSGGDQETARFLYSEYFSFYPTCKIWLFVNHKPQVEDDSHGFWRRVRLIPFNRKFAESEQDKDLSQKLKNELPGILNWLVKGCLLWQKEGLNPIPEIVSLATNAYQQENDVLAEFLAEMYVESLDGETKASEFYKSYTKWAEEQGLKGKDVLSNTTFGRRMTDKFIKKSKNGRAFYQNIVLKGEEAVQNSSWYEQKTKPEVVVEPNFQQTFSTHDVENNLLKSPSNPLPSHENPLQLAMDTKGKICPVCRGIKFWKRSDNVDICSTCHPN